MNKTVEFELCRQCHNNDSQKSIKTCRFCQDFALPQYVLCDTIKQNYKEINTFDCKAFRPLIAAVGNSDRPSVPETPEQESDQGSTRQQWFNAYAVQRLKQDPNQVYSSLKYHLCLVTKQRAPVFSDPQQHVEWLTASLQDIEPQFKETLIRLLWLDTDHVHIYIESTPDYAAYNIASVIVTQLNSASGGDQQPCFQYPLWETGFFMETIG